MLFLTNIRFSRKDFEASETKLLHKGRSANAYLSIMRHDNDDWVVKDFDPCWSFIKWTWGAWMARREFRALQKLQDAEGFPKDVFMMDRFALCYRFIAGTTIREVEQSKLNGEYFLKLEELVQRMHEHGIIHLDIRYRRNILITEEDEPYLLDFQTSLILSKFPRFMHQWLKNIDLSGVYKQWHKRDPESIDAERLKLLNHSNRRRKLWLLKGYAGIKRKP